MPTRLLPISIRFRRVFLAWPLVNWAAIIGAVSAGLHRGQATFYFKEHEFITFISALQLGFAAMTAWSVYIVQRGAGRGTGRRFWALCSFAFFWLMCDEWFMIHEGIDDGILGAMGYTPAGRHFLYDWLVIAGYGVGALLVSIRYYREVLCTRRRAGLFVAAAAFFLAQTVVDAWSGGAWLMVMEEGFKLISICLFFLFFLAAFYDSVESVTGDPAENPARIDRPVSFRKEAARRTADRLPVK